MTILKTIEQIQFEVGHTIEIYANRIRDAYVNSAYDLDITAKIKLSKKDGKDSITNHIEFYPEPKTKSEKATIIIGAHEQLPLPENSKRSEILFRNFDDLRAILAKLRWMQDVWKKTSLVFKQF